jgi:hypothetical protein
MRTSSPLNPFIHARRCSSSKTVAYHVLHSIFIPQKQKRSVSVTSFSVVLDEKTGKRAKGMMILHLGIEPSSGACEAPVLTAIRIEHLLL